MDPPSDEQAQLVKGALMTKYPNKLSSKPAKRHVRVVLFPLKIMWKSLTSEKISSIDFKSIIEIRSGPNTEAFASYKHTTLDSLAFSVIYLVDGRFKSLNLVTETDIERSLWVAGLRNLLFKDVDSLDNDILKLDEFLKSTWKEFDPQDSKVLNLEKIIQLMKHLNVTLTKTEIKGAFKSSEMTQTDFISFAQFEQLYRSIRYRPDIADLFAGLSVDSFGIPFDQFYRFLIEIQKVDWDLVKCQEIFIKFTPPLADYMPLDHFAAYLLSSRNGVIKKQHTTVFQDMSKPLYHYFINSSHNTYLMGDQIMSISSAEGYIRALQRGCRCVELDCWDGPNNTPMIYHGHTLTSKITFQHAIEAIAKYAFTNCDTPLILSLELRCSLEQQNVIADILQGVIGPLICANPDCIESSPNDLRNKIIIKANNMRVWDTDEVEHDVLAPDRKSLLKKPSKPQFESPTSESLNSLKRLIALNGISIKGETLEKSYGSHIITMNERKAQTFIQKSPEHIKNIAKHSLIRIYPSIVRVTSSNLDPFQHWFLGVQMVALNFQTFDRAMELNQALFSMNGGCGYVRKPTNELRQTHLSITIISAQIQLSKSSSHSSNTFTEIEIIGHTLDAAKHRIKPKSTLANRIIWGETVGFDLMYPSLDFIRVLVADNENRSNFCALIDSLEQGYRHIPLKKDGSLVPFSSLFVKIEFS